jgi:hypothetical protein
VYARLETSNFRTLGNFRNSLDWVSPNQEENSQLVLMPEAAIAAFCILALALFETIPCQQYQLRPQVAPCARRCRKPWSPRNLCVRQRPTDAESDAESGPTAPTQPPSPKPECHPQAQPDAANTAVQAPAAAADAQRIEAVIATIASNRPNRC